MNKKIDRIASIASVVGLAISVLTWFYTDWRLTSIISGSLVFVIISFYIFRAIIRTFKKLIIGHTKNILLEAIGELLGFDSKMSWYEFYSFVDSLTHNILEDKNWIPDWIIAMDGGGLSVAAKLLEVYRFEVTPSRIVNRFNARVLYQKTEGEGSSKGTSELRNEFDKGNGVSLHPNCSTLPNLENCNVLIVDSQIVSGTTMDFMKKMILDKGAREVKTAVAVKRPKIKQKIRADYFGGISEKKFP
ncbi:MAG: phosphoribosyltransferase family protein [Candidatus Hodarchaeota archaeon]